jgi:hypothetical protein
VLELMAGIPALEVISFIGEGKVDVTKNLQSCGSPGVAAGATEIRLDTLAVWQRQWRVGLIAATVLVSRVDAQTPFLMTPALEIGDDNYVFSVVINSEWRLVTVASN